MPQKNWLNPLTASFRALVNIASLSSSRDREEEGTEEKTGWKRDLFPVSAKLHLSSLMFHHLAVNQLLAGARVVSTTTWGVAAVRRWLTVVGGHAGLTDIAVNLLHDMRIHIHTHTCVHISFFMFGDKKSKVRWKITHAFISQEFCVKTSCWTPCRKKFLQVIGI